LSHGSQENESDNCKGLLMSGLDLNNVSDDFLFFCWSNLPPRDRARVITSQRVFAPFDEPDCDGITASAVLITPMVRRNTTIEEPSSAGEWGHLGVTAPARSYHL
jgi:hypothetical protein